MDDREKAKLKFITYLKKTAEEAANANGGKFQEYSDGELFDACYIFMEILVAKSFEKFEASPEALSTIAETAPTAFYEFVEAVTGVKVKEGMRQRVGAALGKNR